MRRRLLGSVAVGGVAGVAAWSLVADGKAVWTVVAGAVAAVAGAFAPSVAERVRDRWEARERSRSLVTGTLVAELPASVAWLLHPAKEVIGFFGRGWVLQELQSWCADPDMAVVRLVAAPGGYGKTRLARELCARLPGWASWWVKDGGEADAIAAITTGTAPGRVLMVVDYADARDPAAVAGLLVAAAGRAGARVLLLARGAGPWWTSLSASHPAQATLVDALTVPGNVIALPARVDDRPPDQIVAAAVAEFAAHLRYAVPPGFRSRQHDPDTPVLRLHAEALLAVLGGSRSGDDR
ncbi:MAG TPA: hypothetical protein VGR06_40385, partial [Actinophytocola sp.]|nr:hypothetical protein [Actinophytocola sp.]